MHIGRQGFEFIPNGIVKQLYGPSHPIRLAHFCDIARWTSIIRAVFHASLDKLRQAKKLATEAGQPGKEANLIQIFDTSGKPLYLTKEQWRTKVLPGMLSARWDNPDELYQVIVGTLQHGLPADAAEAAEHLHGIEPNHSRAVCAWANVLMGMKVIEKAEQALNSYIKQYGEDGYVVANLAKVYAARDENDQAGAILWHALELDPNQNMAVGWFAALATNGAARTRWLKHGSA